MFGGGSYGFGNSANANTHGTNTNNNNNANPGSFFGSSANVAMNMNNNSGNNVNNNMNGNMQNNGGSANFGSPFGTSANLQIPTNSTTPSTSAFGAAAGASPFGNPNPAAVAVAPNTINTNIFGTSSNVVPQQPVTPAAGAVNSMMSPFGTSATTVAPAATPMTMGTGMGMGITTANPFAPAPMSAAPGGPQMTPAPSVFGTSANVRQQQQQPPTAATTHSGFGMSSSTSGGGFGAIGSSSDVSAGTGGFPSGFGTSQNVNTTSASNNIFGGTGTNSNSTGFGTSSNVAPSPFGTSQSQSTTAPAQGATKPGFDDNGNMTYVRPGGRGAGNATATASPFGGMVNDDEAQQIQKNEALKIEKQNQLEKLKAKLEAKKKKIMEMKKKREQEQGQEQGGADGGSGTGTSTGGDNGEAGGDKSSRKGDRSGSKLNPNAPAWNQNAVGSTSSTAFEQSGNGGFGSGMGARAGTGFGSSSSSSPFASSYVTGEQQQQKQVKGRIPRRKQGRPTSTSPRPPQTDEKSANNIKGGTGSGDDANAYAALAEKNALRFAPKTNRASTAMLPADLQKEVNNNNSNASSNNKEMGEYPSSSSQQQLSSQSSSSMEKNQKRTKSLIGTCLHMCPDSELIQREQECDIQLLEQYHPSIHPSNWTLRNTCIKRFRRSAADFKLDIPELVRPPHILEKVCGYLEEWIMERDRQGPDPRFGGTSPPPPLDVYQFLWDRTRMIRKDFILQNFIGTGGKCNATAVRCHERIARWHTLCEHQLSHIPDYIEMQSQQNIQELGQTMKTLNMYYDDAGGRSTLEENGVASTDDNVHGCQSAIVHGKNPVDYNGQSLNNEGGSIDVAKRIVGSRAMGKAAGTAEPEMRGLYILLTINNDGGMEVLKYAARLSRDRPKIFHSKPVQLALQVYKARREYNYAKFFSILRSKSTPYLYACIMFKYVETMRKAAFKIMAKTFGTKKKGKESGERESVYDQYPLRDLVHLLCFEDLDEAKKSCEHYNIHVRKVSWEGIVGEGGNGEEIDVIFWRHSDFREPRDPSKGHILHLKPRKMNRVIENKLNGITRLAICRGEVSGEGATLDMDPEAMAKEAKLREVMRKKKEENRVAQVKAMEKAAQEEAQRKRKEELIKQEQLRKAREDAIQKEQAARELAARKEAERKRENEARMKQERMAEAARKAEAEQKRAQEAAAAALKAEKLRLEQEERLRVQRAEEAQKRLEEEKRERELQAKLKKEREEEARREFLRRQAEEERLRKLEEERQRQLKLKREHEAELERQRQIRAEEERRLELEWQNKINFARKVVAMKRWCAILSAIRGPRERTKASIEAFNPLSAPKFSFHSTPKHPIYSRKTEEYESDSGSSTTHDSPVVVSYEEVFYQLGTDTTSTIDLSEQLFSILSRENLWRVLDERKFSYSAANKSIILFKVGIVVMHENQDEYLASMIKLWIDARLQLGKVSSKIDGSFEVRTVVSSFECSETACRECDAVLIIVPPVGPRHALAPCDVPGDTPQFVLDISNSDLNVGDFDRLLDQGCSYLIRRAAMTLREQPLLQGLRLFVVEKISLRRICFSTLRRTMCSFSNKLVGVTNTIHRLPPHLQRASMESRAGEMADHCRQVLSFLLNELGSTGEGACRIWPAIEFIAGKQKDVPSYFSENDPLPLDWRDTFNTEQLQEIIWGAFPSLMQPDNDSRIDSFLHDILDHAPAKIQQKCGALWQSDDLEKCLEISFQWNENAEVDDEYFVYLPVGYASGIIDQYLERELKPNLASVEKQEQEEQIHSFMIDEQNVDVPSSPTSNDSLIQQDNQHKETYITPVFHIDGTNNTQDYTDEQPKEEAEMMEPMLLPFTSPYKRSITPSMAENGTLSGRKRFRSMFRDDDDADDVDAMEKPTLVISDDLKKARDFTKNLRNSCKKGADQMDFIARDPNLSKLVESDESLKKLLQKMV